MTRLTQFFSELKRRNVFRAGVGYLILAWLVMQIADVLLDAFESPSWIIQSIVVALAIGFPVTLVLAWVYEITTTGFKRTEDVEIGESITELTGRKIDFIVIGILTVALTMFAFDKFIYESADVQRGTGPGEHEISIGVFPFRMESEQVVRHFSQLSNELVRTLRRSKIIRLASDDAIASVPNNGSLVEQAAQLGVRYLVSGTLRTADGNLYLSVTLFDSDKGKAILVRDYSNARSPLITTTIAEDLVAATGDEAADFGQDDVDPVAYDKYLRARQIMAIDSMDQEVELYLNQALELEPRFALAHAAMCDMYLVHYNSLDTSEDFRSAEGHCLRAWTIDSSSAEVMVSLANLSSQSGQIEKARDFVTTALSINPAYQRAQIILARTYRNEDPEYAEAQFKNIIARNPGSPVAYSTLQNMYFYQGRYAEAVEQQRWVVRLKPNSENAKFVLSSNLMLAGMFDGARKLLTSMLEAGSPRIGDIHSNLATLMFFDGDYSGAEQLYRKALDREPENAGFHRNLGDAVWHADSQEAAQPIFRNAIMHANTRLKVDPNDAWAISTKMIALASIGDKDGFEAQKSRMLEVAANDPQIHYDIAVGASRLGNFETTREFARQAFDAGYPVVFLNADPDIALAGVSF